MSKSHQFYDLYSDSYIRDTESLDLSAIYSKFIPHLKPGAKILDIGCGSGRELVSFSKMGFLPSGIEPSVKLYEHAKARSSATIYNQTFFEFETKEHFDAAWACASLLHLKKSEIPSAFRKIHDLLNLNGIFYCSFKEGIFEGERNGRYFTDLTQESLKELVAPYFEIIDLWQGIDVRIDNQFAWVNLVGQRI